MTCVRSLCTKTKCLRRKLTLRDRDGTRGVVREAGRGRGKGSGDCQRGEESLVDGTSGILCYRRKEGGRGKESFGNGWRWWTSVKVLTNVGVRMRVRGPVYSVSGWGWSRVSAAGPSHNGSPLVHVEQCRVSGCR